MGLEVHPELWRVAEIQAQPQRCVGRNAPSVVEDLGNAVRRDPDSLCELILREAVFRQEFVSQHFTGRDRCELIWGHSLSPGSHSSVSPGPSVIIHDLDLMRLTFR